MKEKFVPAVGVVVAATRTSLLAGAALTVRLAVAFKEFAESDADRLCGPAWMRVAAKLAWPLLSFELGGSTAPEEMSLVLKCTVPA